MPKFSGGIHVDDKGYLRISAGPCRNRRVHELVAEAKLGRKLREDEEVHHKNGDKLDCSPDNLEVRGKSEHGAVSSRQYWYLKEHVWNRETQQWKEFFAEANHGIEEVNL